jgi:Cu-Zn family superoxide dismutase
MAPQNEPNFRRMPRNPLISLNVSSGDTGKLFKISLTVAEVQGHALMVHAGGDNYSDTPAPLSGGGARIACAVVK